ncbi:MAG: translational GTPase TypA [Anaerolineaceae bacterium]|jgi:GTP-binding protein|nr:translational GTPase TypA [Anaerolineaceae bacterium]MDI9531727.1 translational GTPase TypA [Chloroflexota bacterium]
MLKERRDIRNVAIIAHVDHGKTTLIDSMLKQAKVFRENQKVQERIMDSNDLERERGITILAKNTAITLPDNQTGELVKINIVDTPGHADFGGEVERIMNMVDGVLLLVDAVEGPKPQTRFVLKQAIAKNLPTIVVINKLDRRDANADQALNATFDLFVELGASSELLEFPIIYADGLDGKAGTSEKLENNLAPLFECILRHIPGPLADLEAPFQMLVTNLGYDEYSGVTATGRIHAGSLKAGGQMTRIKLDGSLERIQAKYLFTYQGLSKAAIEKAEAGEIVTIGGLKDIQIGETLADPEHAVALPAIHVQQPTVQMTIGVNTSPFSGREGKWGTTRKLWERLNEELRTNIALRVAQTEQKDTFLVSGRGELHLGILIETMRREGYEFQVSRPEAIIVEDESGRKMEPFEEVHIDVDSESVGIVVEMLGQRKGKMTNMTNNPDGTVHLIYSMPTRGLLGFRYKFLNATRGKGILNSFYVGVRPLEGAIESRNSSSIVAREGGVSSTYGLKNAEPRGTLFIGQGVEVYEGMIVGETPRAQDLAINIAKKKHLTNMRQSIRDLDERLDPPRQMSLDEMIEYLGADELLEVTPENLRLRKRILDTHERLRSEKTGEIDDD